MSFALKTEPLSDLIDGGGRIVLPARPGQQFDELDHEAVVELFERYGILLFRGFGLDTENITAVTDCFTETYAPDAVRRPRRFGKKQIRDVEVGDTEIGFHSEAAFAPTWPEIIWFYCRVPSNSGASTTVCDGVMLWKRLSPQTRKFFLTQPVKYRYLYELGDQRVPGRGKEPWPFQAVGVDGYWDRDNGVADLSVWRFAVQESRAGGLCFANHVFTDFANLTTTMSDGTPIPHEMLVEIREAARLLTYDVQWQARDLLMLDNRRFTHGRRAFDARHDPRDIVQVQTALASFAYGATMRRAIRQPGLEARQAMQAEAV
jgi:alpha-ketoglutarate-dependent taurine dioxygenase